MTKAIGSKSNLIFVTILKQNSPTVCARYAQKNYTLNYSKNKKPARSAREIAVLKILMSPTNQHGGPELCLNRKIHHAWMIKNIFYCNFRNSIAIGFAGFSVLTAKESDSKSAYPSADAIN